MKHVMMGALIAAALLTAPIGHADPDPHKPDMGAHYCPGGGTADTMSHRELSCDGVPYDDGSYWRAYHGDPGTNTTVIMQCVKPPPEPGLFTPAQQGPVPAPVGSCQ